MAMASISNPPPPCIYRCSSPISCSSSPLTLSFPRDKKKSMLQIRLYAVKTGSDSGSMENTESRGSSFLRKPSVVHENVLDEVPEEDEGNEEKDGFTDSDINEMADWEDQILEETVPLVGFVRMIIHSDKYKSGDRLSPEHERTIIDRLLPNHPEFEKKIGCGVDYITVGYHPEFEGSRCLFIVRKDGESVDFSYWKCIKGLIRKKYPLHADTFILRHFRQRRRIG